MLISCTKYVNSRRVNRNRICTRVICPSSFFRVLLAHRDANGQRDVRQYTWSRQTSPAPHNAHRWLEHSSSVLASTHATSRKSLGSGTGGHAPSDTAARLIRVFQRTERACWLQLVLGGAPRSRTKVTCLVASHRWCWGGVGVVRSCHASPKRRASCFLQNSVRRCLLLPIPALFSLALNNLRHVR